MALLVIVLCAVVSGVLAFLYFRGPRSGGQTAIPSEMGGAVPTAALSRLFDRAAQRDLDSLGLRVSVGQKGEKPVYHIKDLLRVGYSTQRPAMCALFHRDARGAITLINPDPGGSAAMRAGEEWVSEELGVTEPTGSESFVAVCALREDERSRIDLASILKQDPAQWGEQISAVREDFEVAAR